MCYLCLLYNLLCAVFFFATEKTLLEFAKHAHFKKRKKDRDIRNEKSCRVAALYAAVAIIRTTELQNFVAKLDCKVDLLYII